jgi:hypothetical protein
MMGTDMHWYVKDYELLYRKLSFGVGEGDRLQPGWILLSYCFRQITSDFFFFKLIHAIFINVAVFSFFKRESKYVYTCILLYAISSYLLLNFNALRQSFSIGFILYAISYLKRSKYVLSLLFLFLSYMFHNSAILAIVIPFFLLFQKVRINIPVLVCFIAIGVYFLLRIDIQDILTKLIETNMLSDSLMYMGNNYIVNDRLGVHESQMGVFRVIQIVMVLFSVLFYVLKRKDMYMGSFGFVYLLFVVFAFSMPILFRFRLYFEIPFYVIFASVMIEFPKDRFVQIRPYMVVIIFLLYSYYPFRDYFRKYEGSNYRYIDQYYPYHSIFDPEYDYKKMHFFDYL